jgi:tripartite-type tricarboxylate transporter receptor subunit TctC
MITTHTLRAVDIHRINGHSEPVCCWQGICQKVLESDDFKKAAQTLQQTPAFLTAAQFKARIAATYRSHAELVPELNLEKN